jgi:hypothetical protein
MRLFDNRLLRRISGPKRDEVTGERIKLRDGELRDLYSSPSIIRIQVEEDEMSRACSTNGGKRIA